MKSFYSIQLALEHLSTCLVCKHGMGLSCLSAAFPSSVELYYSYITYRTIEIKYEDKFTIDIRNNEITRDVKEIEDLSNIYGYSTPRHTMARNPLSTSGTKYLALNSHCDNCKKYDFVLQLVIQLEPLMLSGVVFNSETITFQTHPMDERWELKNIYTTKRTVYTHYGIPKPGTIVEAATQDLPLLPLDREDPAKTLNRVKNLLIFT